MSNTGSSGGRKSRPSSARRDLQASTEDEVHDFYRKILQSHSLTPDDRIELEQIAEAQAQKQSLIEEVRNFAAEQARKTYKCEVCGLEFLGILAFAEHDAETSHMANQGKRVGLDGSQ